MSPRTCSQSWRRSRERSALSCSGAAMAPTSSARSHPRALGTCRVTITDWRLSRCFGMLRIHDQACQTSKFWRGIIQQRRLENRADSSVQNETNQKQLQAAVTTASVPSFYGLREPALMLRKDRNSGQPKSLMQLKRQCSRPTTPSNKEELLDEKNISK